MLTLDQILGYWPGWVALVVGTVLAFNKLAEESEKFANTFGRIGRKIRANSLKRHHVDIKAAEFAMAVQEAVQVAVAKAREEWETDENEAIAALDRRLSTVSAVTAQQLVDLEELRFQVRCMSAYSDYEVTWHNRLTAKVAAAAGIFHLEDVPTHFGYYEFEKQYRLNVNWRKWGFPEDDTTV